MDNIKHHDCIICDSMNTILKLEDNLLFIECLDCGCEFGNTELIEFNIKLRKDNE